MRKILCIFALLAMAFALVACGGETEKVDAVIVEKAIVDGSYVFYLEYELEGFEEPLTATVYIKTQKEYDNYDIGDTYVFERPITEKVVR